VRQAKGRRTIGYYNVSIGINPRRIVRYIHDNWKYLLAITVFLYMSLKVEPISRDDSHYYRMILAIASIGIYTYFIIRVAGTKKKTATVIKTFYIIAIMAIIFGVFNYYQFDSEVFLTVGDYADATYYYVNSKFFKELGYFELYPAMLVADNEGPNMFNYVNTYTDLHAYNYSTRIIALTKKEEIKRLFTPERWEQFKHDIEFLSTKNLAGGWKYFFTDHGYNPPPTWTIVGGFFSKHVDVENLKLITMIDFALILLMFHTIYKSFGKPTLVFTSLFFLTTFSGRWPILGQALLRFDWLVALILSVCMMKQERHFLAGALLAYSSLTRVFPTIFFLPYALHIIHSVAKDHRIMPRHQEFIKGAAITFILFVVGVLVFFGPQSVIDSKKNLLMHNSPKSYSSHRVGLADAIFFRGETTREEMAEYGDIPGKQAQIQDALPALYAVGILSMLFILAYIFRTDNPEYNDIYLGIIPLFILTNPQINYYNLRLLLIIFHMQEPKRLFNRFGIIWLFLTEAATQYTKVMGYERYTSTCTTSVGLLFYFIILIFFLVYEMWKMNEKK
jgi:hypothetical protein